MNLIIIHSSASPNGRDDRAADIHRWHLERGWSGIGYHYVICLDGKIENGRPEYWTGAHAAGYNEGSIGICLIGTDDFTEAQWLSLDALVEKLQHRYPNARIIGHREVNPNKSCPGFDVQQWLRSR